jgi:hypothetical protein
MKGNKTKQPQKIDATSQSLGLDRIKTNITKTVKDEEQLEPSCIPGGSVLGKHFGGSSKS